MRLRVTQKDSVPFQQFINLGTRLSLSSNQKSSKGWQYRIDGGYDLLMDRVDGGYDVGLRDSLQMEHEGKLDISLSKEFEKFSVGGEIGGKYINRADHSDTLSYAVARFDPWIGFNWKFVKLIGGPKVAMDRNASVFLFYPRLNVEINITNLLVPYFGLNGYYENHTFRSLSRENPFIADDPTIKPTNHRFIAYGGLRGRVAPTVAFNLAVSWEDVRDLVFFIPDQSLTLKNRFLPVYDNGSILTASGEVSLRQSDNLSFILKGNYYQYDLDSLAAPWHKPGWDVNLTTRYAWKKKLVVKADIFVYGKYSVPEPDPLSSLKVKELSGLIDVNLSAEYRINSWMSVFAQVNNLLSDRYFIWQNYPMQRINFLAGLSWIF
jgi:outer membrane receptor protein involved in Fe transport